MSSKFYNIMTELVGRVYQLTGCQVYRGTMDQIHTNLPSKEAQHSNLGMKKGREKRSRDRQSVQRRSTLKLKSNQVAPSCSQVNEAMEKLAHDDFVVDTEEEQHHVIKLIQAMPRPLPMKKQMRDMLLAGPVKPSKGIKYRLSNKWNSFKISWKEFLYSVEFWRSSIKKIEGQQGTGVVSFFVFLRWLFFLNVFIALLMFLVVTFIQISYDPISAYDSDLTGAGTTAYSTSTATTCTASYSPNVSSSVLTLILDFVQGTGWMEKTAMFNGYYTDRKIQLAASNYNMPLAFFLTTVSILLISLIVMVRNTLTNFKDAVLSKENSRQANYCNSVFAGQDFSVVEQKAVELKQKSMYRGLVADLEEQKHEEVCKNRTTGQKCRLYSLRFVINIIILAMLGGAFAAIYLTQDYSTQFTTKSDVEENYHFLIILLVQFLPSIVIGLLNGIYPLIFDVLVTFEGYTPAFVIKISLIRMVFLKLASLGMIVASLHVQITCNDQTTCLVGQNSCPAIECWETYVGSAIYKLVIMDFIINVAVTFGVELPRKLITTRSDSGLLHKIGPAIFDIPKNVLDLVYGQSLLWLGFYFAPLLPAVCIVTYFCLFYVKMLSAMYNTVPPEKPYQASRSNSFFTVILMIAFFLICVPVGYTLSNMDPSPMCGPFRIYGKPSDIIGVQVANAATWFQTIWTVLTSTAVVASLLILLSLAIYYCSALNSAHKELVDTMKDQLVLEGKDKQYLLARIAELSGKPPKKDPPPYQQAKLRTVNETAPPPAELQQTLQNDPVNNEHVGIENDGTPPAADYNLPENVTPVSPPAESYDNTIEPDDVQSPANNNASPKHYTPPVIIRPTPVKASPVINRASPVMNWASDGLGSSPLFKRNRGHQRKTAKEELDEW